jgi:hypothetical protein
MPSFGSLLKKKPKKEATTSNLSPVASNNQGQTTNLSLAQTASSAQSIKTEPASVTTSQNTSHEQQQQQQQLPIQSIPNEQQNNTSSMYRMQTACKE